ALHPARTLEVGCDVHQASLAVATVAPDQGAAVISLGTLGPRPGASAQRLRPLQAPRQPRGFVSAAGPGAAALARSQRQEGAGGWVVAPSGLPHKSGARVTTDRRDARPLAWRLRSGARPPVSGPAVDEAARRDRRRARAEPRRALQA